MSVREMRKRAQVLLIVLLVIDAAAVAVLLSPLGGARAQKREEAAQVRKQWQEEMHKALPVRDIDKKVVEARNEIGSFYKDRVPDRESAVVIELGKVASAYGVKLSNVHYSIDKDDIEGLRKIDIGAGLSGDYIKVVKFINGLERDKTFFIVNSVVLAEQQQAGSVNLELHIETYMRDAVPGQTPTEAPASGGTTSGR